MNNTEKKIDALINALGFDVECVSKTYINGQLYRGDGSVIPISPMDSVFCDVDYRLTKRDLPIREGIDNE